VRFLGSLDLAARWKHDILAVGPTLLIPAFLDRKEHWLDWWVSSWEGLGAAGRPSVADQAGARRRKETSVIVDELLAGWRELSRP
jgi:hypothetical protein